jgi:hypothetical protein
MGYRMYGDTVQLLRYKIVWEDGEESCEEWCISDDHRDEVVQRLGETPHTVETIEQAGNEWIDGMEFKDASLVPKALEMGETAWRERVNASDSELQMMLYLVSMDFRIILLELGVTEL